MHKPAHRPAKQTPSASHKDLEQQLLHVCICLYVYCRTKTESVDLALFEGNVGGGMRTAGAGGFVPRRISRLLLALNVKPLSVLLLVRFSLLRNGRICKTNLD